MRSWCRARLSYIRASARHGHESLKTTSTRTIPQVLDILDHRPWTCSRLRDAGLLSLSEIAQTLDVSTKTIKTWRDHGLLCAHVYNDKNECLYEPVDGNGPVKSQGTKLSERRRFPQFVPDRTNEVQHAT